MLARGTSWNEEGGGMFDWLRRRGCAGASKETGVKRLAFERLEPRSMLSATVYEGGSFVAAATATDPANNLLVTGADSGHEPLVRVFDPDTGIERFSFLAYAEAFRGGVRIAAGDVSGDGIPDIITAAGPGGGPQVRVFDGATGTR